MSTLSNYYAGDVRDSVRYIEKMSRGGLSKFPPLIITCAITGGLHGKEANPNLPEQPEEQVQAAYDAYNAGASMVHIHRRDPENPMQMSWKWEEFAEVNAMIRAKCPDLIVNNTCLGGRMLHEEQGTMGEMMMASIRAKPEVASLDIHCFCEDMPVKARKAPLFGRDEDGVLKFHYSISPENARLVAQTMVTHGIKPEFEMFDIADVKYLNRLIREDAVHEPYWVSMLFGGNGTLPTPDMMLAATRALPDNALFNIIGIGGAQFPMLAMGILLGHHVRVGLEDNVFYAPHQLAQSNAQMVERVVRLAAELGRTVATPAQARQMMGLGAPRAYRFP